MVWKPRRGALFIEPNAIYIKSTVRRGPDPECPGGNATSLPDKRGALILQRSKNLLPPILHGQSVEPLALEALLHRSPTTLSRLR
jgi:hypothetical protein